jgi:hypothetical protein
MAIYSFVEALPTEGIITIPTEYRNPNYAIPYPVLVDEETEIHYFPIPVNLLEIHISVNGLTFSLKDVSLYALTFTDGSVSKSLDPSVWGIYKDVSCDCDAIVLGLATLDGHLHSKLTSIDSKLIALQVFDRDDALEDLPDDPPWIVDTVKLARVLNLLLAYLNRF